MRFLPRCDVVKLMAEKYLNTTLLVDSFEGAPSNMERFRPFNPFNIWPEALLPVPGQDTRSVSLEGIWQGAKIVDGEVEYSMFTRRPWKRPSDDARRANPQYRYCDSTFAYGNRQISLKCARFLIYAVSYLHLLDKVVPEELIQEILNFASRGGDVIFFDWDGNGDIANEHESYSHSALLAAWFSGSLEPHLFEPARQIMAAPDFAEFQSETAQNLERYTRMLAGRAS
jgi:hypothetical protein